MRGAWRRLGIGAILAANARCEGLHLDPVSLGGTLACALEAIELPPFDPSGG